MQRCKLSEIETKCNPTPNFNFADCSVYFCNYIHTYYPFQLKAFENHQKMSHLIFVPVLDFNAHFVCNVVK